MKTTINKISILIIFIVLCIQCKKPYAPPAILIDYKYLVVDGSIISSPDSGSLITLSRTTKLSDSLKFVPEKGAKVTLEGKTGTIFNFIEQENGAYQSAPQVLGVSTEYRLRIKTSTGDEYLSDYVPVRSTPVIDSLIWQQQPAGEVDIYLNTHDPLNKTNYYRWDFVETWQYTSALNADISVNNSIIFYVDDNTQTYTCWQNNNSAEVLTANTIALKNDVINKFPITTIPLSSEKIAIRYSILVKQYAITESAYQYFKLLKKNTEIIGSLFDTQPVELIGNFSCVNDPSKKVIGYITASTVTQKRIFISKNDVLNWNYVANGRQCDVFTIPQNSSNFLLYNYPDPDYAPYYFADPGNLKIARKECVDCRVKGGINKKPLYW